MQRKLGSLLKGSLTFQGRMPLLRMQNMPLCLGNGKLWAHKNHSDHCIPSQLLYSNITLHTFRDLLIKNEIGDGRIVRGSQHSSSVSVWRYCLWKTEGSVSEELWVRQQPRRLPCTGLLMSLTLPGGISSKVRVSSTSVQLPLSLPHYQGWRFGDTDSSLHETTHSIKAPEQLSGNQDVAYQLGPESIQGLCI